MKKTSFVKSQVAGERVNQVLGIENIWGPLIPTDLLVVDREGTNDPLDSYPTF